MDRLAIITMLAKEFDHNHSAIGAETTFEKMGMDSFEIVDFLAKVEEHFNTVIENDKMLELKCIQDVLNVIE